MATSAVHAGIVRHSRTSKKLEKPRPLNISGQNRHSLVNTPLGTVEDIITLMETVAQNLMYFNYDKTLQQNIKNLNSTLKLHGAKLESIYKDILDRSFVTFRNASRDGALDYVSRILLLEMIELRASHWNTHDSNSYYKFVQDEEQPATPMTADALFPPSFSYVPVSPVLAAPAPQPLLLGPGELVKSSGKYPAPTRVVGKNYCKDEVVIRNADSGKVSPGAKERLVQVTGPTEERINYAKQLMEDTIRRNASPVRGEGSFDRPDSSSSINTDSDDSMLPSHSGTSMGLPHSFSTSDANLGEYKYTVTVGEESIKITGFNLELVRVAKIVLDEYFAAEPAVEVLADEDPNDDVVLFDDVDDEPFTNSVITISTDSIDSHEATKAKEENGSADATTDEPSDKMKSLQLRAGFHSYTREEISLLADSPLSRQTPPDWTQISRDYFAIMKKVPFEWIESTNLLKRRGSTSSASVTAPNSAE